jgi:hypothetical protein
VNDDRISVETLFDHFGMYRWKIQRESSMRFVDPWSQVSHSQCDDPTKIRLVNVLWALMSFERAYDTLHVNAEWMEKANREGCGGEQANIP